jgi:hypothetical protein
MKTDIFTLIAYRPNGIDTCRGCLMGQSDSDLEINSYTDIESIAKAIFKYKEIDKKSEREYCDYDLTILINGHDRYSCTDDDERERIDNIFDEIYNYEEIVKQKEKERLDEEAKQLAIRKENERLESIRLKAEKTERERLAKIESDRQLYEELKKRFE